MRKNRPLAANSRRQHARPRASRLAETHHSCSSTVHSGASGASPHSTSTHSTSPVSSPSASSSATRTWIRHLVSHEPSCQDSSACSRAASMVGDGGNAKRQECEKSPVAAGGMKPRGFLWSVASSARRGRSTTGRPLIATDGRWSGGRFGRRYRQMINHLNYFRGWAAFE